MPIKKAHAYLMTIGETLTCEVISVSVKWSIIDVEVRNHILEAKFVTLKTALKVFWLYDTTPLIILIN